MKVQVFIPCFIDQFYPQVGFSVLKILEQAGVEVSYNPKQTCCGQPSFNSGYWAETEQLARKFMRDFPPEMPVVMPSASCAAFVRNDYRKLSADNEFQAQCRWLSANVYELSDFLVNVLQKTDFGAVFEHKVTVHDACSALRAYGLSHELRTLLGKVQGLEIDEMPESGECCGFGGTFSMKMKPISQAMVKRKVENALKTSATHLTSTEVSCLMNIEGFAQKQGVALKVLHFAEILTSGW